MWKVWANLRILPPTRWLEHPCSVRICRPRSSDSSNMSPTCAWMAYAIHAHVGDILELSEDLGRQIRTEQGCSNHRVGGRILRFAHTFHINSPGVARNFQRFTRIHGSSKVPVGNTL